MDYYEELISIYGGSASTQPLRFGCQSLNVTNFGFSTDSPHDENQTISTGGMSTSSNTEDVNDEKSESEVIQTPVLNKIKQKRPHTKDPFQLIDDKRQHVEKSLSARQRDQLLLKESREDAMFREELCDSIKQSNEMFAGAMSTSTSFI